MVAGLFAVNYGVTNGPSDGRSSAGVPAELILGTALVRLVPVREHDRMPACSCGGRSG